jgi:hypothetical protein
VCPTQQARALSIAVMTAENSHQYTQTPSGHTERFLVRGPVLAKKVTQALSMLKTRVRPGDTFLIGIP